MVSLRSFKWVMALVVLFTLPALAMPTGALTGWSGNVPINVVGTDGKTLQGSIDYAVYDSSVFNPGLTGGQYIYVYQVHNSGQSDVSINHFAVSIKNWDSISVGTINWSEDGGVTPFMEFFSPDSSNAQSAEFMFLFDLIDAGDHSNLLAFSSDHAPVYNYGSVMAGGMADTIEELAAPGLPEPATLAMLSIGSLALVARRNLKD